MARRSVQSCAFVAAIAACFAHMASAKDSIEYSPARLGVAPGNFSECKSPGELATVKPMEATARVVISKAGGVEKFTLPERLPAWMQELTACILDRITFVPETRDGKPVGRHADLSLSFAGGEGTEANTIRVLNVGPLVTAPYVLGNAGKVLEGCLPRSAPSGVSRIVIGMTIAPDGAAIDVQSPVGSAPWMDATAQCLRKRLKFLPGSRDGIPVQAQVQVPIVLHSESMPPGDVTVAKPPSDPEQLEAAYRACYPATYFETVRNYYRFDVDVDGSVSNVKLVRGSGDERLDQAGACILANVRFSPLMHGDTALKSNVTWELPIRPPR